MNSPLHIAFDLGSFSIKGAVGRVNQNEELEILQEKIANDLGYTVVRHVHQLFVKPLTK